MGFPGAQSLVVAGAGILELGILRAALDVTIARLWTRRNPPFDAPSVVGAEPSGRAAISALDAAHAVMELLNVSMETLATVTGIGRTTILNWRRANAVPRPSTVRDLWRLHGVAVSLRSAVGAAGARSWVRVGSPSPLDLLLAGDIREVERRVARLAFDPRQLRPWRPSISADSERDIPTARAGHTARASRSRVRRGRLR